jgi:hypothetical protein
VSTNGSGRPGKSQRMIGGSHHSKRPFSPPSPTHLRHPHFLAHLATDVTQPFLVIDALGLQSAVAKHANHLGIFLRGVARRRR